MGTYTYGVSSKSRKIKGFDKPVYNVKFLGKAPGFRFGDYQINSFENICAGYDRKDSMRGELIAQAITPDPDEEMETLVEVYRYGRGYNTYTDGGDMNFLELVGYAEKVGNRYQKISKARYTAEQKKIEDAQGWKPLTLPAA